MITRLSIVLLSSGILLAQGPILAPERNPVSLLPDGSVLKNILIPRYDENRRLVGDLKAETMTLIGQGRIQGENVLIKFYEGKRTLRGTITLDNAMFEEAEALLYANEEVNINNDRLIAKGTGIVYSFNTGEGFLKGPATTWISNPAVTETSMNFHSPAQDHIQDHIQDRIQDRIQDHIQPSARPAMHMPALIALCLAPTIAIAAPPAFVSEAELAEIKTEATSQKKEIEAINADTKATFNKDVTLGEKASDAADRFVQASQLKLASKKIEKAQDTPQPAAAPLKVAPSPQDTIINCDGGMYFDAEAGILVYLKNVRVKDPRFELSGADELKVFFEQKEPATAAGGEAPKDDQEPKPTGPAANFGDVEKLIATGTVRFLQKSVDGKEPVEASGGILTYYVPKGEIIISERYPWVRQGTFYARAQQPNLTLRLLNDGSFSTQGNWEMGGNLNLKKD